jgi:hypothetical protein
MYAYYPMINIRGDSSYSTIRDLLRAIIVG